jgi:hypothetical protein
MSGNSGKYGTIVLKLPGGRLSLIFPAEMIESSSSDNDDDIIIIVAQAALLLLRLSITIFQLKN